MEYGENGMDRMCVNEVESTLFIVKLLETKQPQQSMELKLPESQKAATKQNVSKELKTPWTVGTTTEGLW